MQDQKIIDEFLEYNRTHLKTITKSMHILADKYGCGWLTIRKIIGDDNIALVKNNPSERQYEVMDMTIKGISQSEIARELKVDRQVVNDCLKYSVKKGLMEKFDIKKGKSDYKLTEDGVEFMDKMKGANNG